jgi:RNA polymerase sigma-70 factor (ECF subfamily)
LVESDEELISRVRRGDRDAFCGLVERYEQPALLMARSILHCWHDARDAVQDSFVTAYSKINRLWSPHKFGAWFLRIVRRQALSHRRRRITRSRRLVAMVAELNAELESEPASDMAASVDVAALLARLPEAEIVVVSLRHFNEMSVSEIAHTTGRPIGTVTKQLSRAYARMRPWIEEGT